MGKILIKICVLCWLWNSIFWFVVASGSVPNVLEKEPVEENDVDLDDSGPYEEIDEDITGLDSFLIILRVREKLIFVSDWVVNESHSMSNFSLKI